MPRYVTYSEIKKLYQVSPETVKNWARNNSIGYKTIQNAQRKTWLYDIESVGKFVDNSQTKKEGRKIIYARVSSKKQEEDLNRQIELLKSKYSDFEVIKDIGSGLNFKRPGFSKLVAGVCRQDVQRIVVTYKDRLCRFGYELFEQMCEEHACKILVFSKLDEKFEEKETQELQEDLLSIVNVFVAKRNGKRAGQLSKARKEARQEKKERTKLNDEDTIVSQSKSEDST